MDQELELVNCVHALWFQRTLSPELAGRSLDALCVEPQSHLVGAFRTCLLLYNDRFMSTWTVDEEYLKQLEHIISPWCREPQSQQHGYQLLPGSLVERQRTIYSLGTRTHLLECISAMLELEYWTIYPENAVETYIAIFKALQSMFPLDLQDLEAYHTCRKRNYVWY